MPKICELTGKKAMVGNRVSHANNKTKRRFEVNLTRKKFYLKEEDRWLTLRVCSSGIKLASKIGVFAAVKKARENGYLNK